MFQKKTNVGSLITYTWLVLDHLFAEGAYDRQGFRGPAASMGRRANVRMDDAMAASRAYEERIDCSEAMIHVALGSLLLRRIAHQ
jgi:hypothetical protein